MKKVIFIFFVVSSLMACNENKKSGWSEEDKRKARENLSDDYFKIFGDKKQEMIDCFLESLENNYANYEESTKDDLGVDTIGRNCQEKVMSGK